MTHPRFKFSSEGTFLRLTLTETDTSVLLTDRDFAALIVEGTRVYKTECLNPIFHELEKKADEKAE